MLDYRANRTTIQPIGFDSVIFGSISFDKLRWANAISKSSRNLWVCEAMDLLRNQQKKCTYRDPPNAHFSAPVRDLCVVLEHRYCARITANDRQPQMIPRPQTIPIWIANDPPCLPQMIS